MVPAANTSIDRCVSDPWAGVLGWERKSGISTSVFIHQLTPCHLSPQAQPEYGGEVAGSPCSLLGGSAEALWTRMQMHRGNCRQALPAKPFLLLMGSADAGPVHKHSIHARTWTQQHLEHKPEQAALICLNPKWSQIRSFIFETASSREPQLQKHQEKSLNQAL